MIKLIALTFLLSSCAMLDGAKSMLEGSYEAGKFAGRNEVLEALEENKKKLLPLENITIGELLSLSKESTVMAPITFTVVQLLLERGQLKKALAEIGTTSDDAK